MIEQISINRIHGLAFVPGDFLNPTPRSAGIPEEVSELADNLRSEFERMLPSGEFSCTNYSLGTPALLIILTGSKKSDWQNRIINNDKLYHQIWLRDFAEGKLTAECTVGGSFIVPGSMGKYVPVREKLGWAKKTGNCDAIYKHMTKYFQKMRDAYDKYNLGGQNA